LKYKMMRLRGSAEALYPRFQGAAVRMARFSAARIRQFKAR
jgi:hypothetical protein